MPQRAAAPNPVQAEDIDAAELRIQAQLGGVPAVEVKNGRFERVLAARDDAEDFFEMPDPVKGAIGQYGKPGMVNRLLAEKVNKRKGLRGWKIVKDENGDPVEVGGMLLGEMPERKARARTRQFQNESRQFVTEIKDSYAVQQETVLREVSGASGQKISDLREQAVVIGSNDTIVREYGHPA